MKKTKFRVLLEHFQEFHEKPMCCFYQIPKTLSFFGSSSQNFWTSDVLIWTSQSRKLLAQRDKFEKMLL